MDDEENPKKPEEMNDFQKMLIQIASAKMIGEILIAGIRFGVFATIDEKSQLEIYCLELSSSEEA